MIKKKTGKAPTKAPAKKVLRADATRQEMKKDEKKAAKLIPKAPEGPKFDEVLFKKYAGESDVITPEGLAKIAEDLGVDMSNDVYQICNYLGRNACSALCLRKQILRGNHKSRIYCRTQEALDQNQRAMGGHVWILIMSLQCELSKRNWKE